jgi:hypothetical protein
MNAELFNHEEVAGLERHLHHLAVSTHVRLSNLSLKSSLEPADGRSRRLARPHVESVHISCYTLSGDGF